MNTCPICSRTYKRPEHLRRHLLSHSSIRPYTCQTCGSSFQRTDVLRRHQQTCVLPSRHGSEPSAKRVARSPPTQTAQHGLTDSLATAFPSLDEQSNLAEQSTLSFENIAGWVVNATSDDGEVDIWQEFLNTSSGTFTPMLLQTLDAPGTSRLGFLDRFTSKTGLAYSFDCGTKEQRQDFALRHLNDDADEPQTLKACDAPGDVFRERVSEPDRSSTEATSFPQWLSDPLALKSHEIITGIKDIVLNKSRQSFITMSWSAAVQDTCWKFFSPSNIRHCLDMYWALWHPNVNIVHKPTFDPCTSKAYLVAAMCLMGASVSPISSDSATAKLWFNCVEELVFSSDDLCDDIQLVQCRDTGKETWRREHLRALQAAYMVLLYQNWEGTDASKRRIRRLRFSTVVAVVRDVGIPNALHTDHKDDLYHFSWLDFVATEELIRLVLWVFLVDTAFVIFNNLPPRMVISEMSISPASAESCFQADTAEACHDALQEADPRRRASAHWTFSSLFVKLYDHPMDAVTRATMSNLGPLNLFAMTSALHSLVFHFRSSFSCRGSLADVKHALNNWSSVWSLYSREYARTSHHCPAGIPSDELRGPDMWRRVGFMCHAEEYWYLAKLMVDHHDPDPEMSRIRSRTEDPGDELALVMDDDQQVPFDVASTTSRGRLEDKLRNYDETSMRQINDLIAEFRRAEI